MFIKTATSKHVRSTPLAPTEPYYGSLVYSLNAFWYIAVNRWYNRALIIKACVYNIHVYWLHPIRFVGFFFPSQVGRSSTRSRGDLLLSVTCHAWGRGPSPWYSSQCYTWAKPLYTERRYTSFSEVLRPLLRSSRNIYKTASAKKPKLSKPPFGAAKPPQKGRFLDLVSLRQPFV